MTGKAKRELRLFETELSVRCANGVVGVYSEVFWRDASGRVVKYNLAFINHGLYSRDNGRVLGYDNAHGFHERHWMGRSEPFTYKDFDELLARFVQEVSELRKRDR